MDWKILFIVIYSHLVSQYNYLHYTDGSDIWGRVPQVWPWRADVLQSWTQTLVKLTYLLFPSNPEYLAFSVVFGAGLSALTLQDWIWGTLLQKVWSMRTDVGQGWINFHLGISITYCTCEVLLMILISYFSFVWSGMELNVQKVRTSGTEMYQDLPSEHWYQHLLLVLKQHSY